MWLEDISEVSLVPPGAPLLWQRIPPYLMSLEQVQKAHTVPFQQQDLAGFMFPECSSAWTLTVKHDEKGCVWVDPGIKKDTPVSHHPAWSEWGSPPQLPAERCMLSFHMGSGVDG